MISKEDSQRFHLYSVASLSLYPVTLRQLPVSLAQYGLKAVW